LAGSTDSAIAGAVCLDSGAVEALEKELESAGLTSKASDPGEELEGPSSSKTTGSFSSNQDLAAATD